jgi:lambda repressor-like predicted transcriptional regulator
VTRTNLQIAGEQAGKARSATEMRDYWIREAHKEGSSLRAIGRATGLSHTAIAKILARG